MKLLVVHTWLRGNLGDVLQASVLMRALRELRPAVLDLGGYPAEPGAAAQELVALADHHVAEAFNWYWRYVPEGPRALTLEPGWRRRRAKLFRQYDAIVSAPGPFLAEYDARWPSALCDLKVATELSIPFILSSHSIGPLPETALGELKRATVCVAREVATQDYLAQHGVRSVLSADLAFLYPYQEALESAPPSSIKGAYRLLFLRSNNLGADAISLEGRTLVCGSRRIELSPGEQLVVATSDGLRDNRFLSKLARRLGVPVATPASVAALTSLVAGSSGVVTDRYHPAICAFALGKPVEILINREPHKMNGLMSLLGSYDFEQLKNLARAGLSAVRGALESGHTARESA